jgi:hypothetical protein
MSYSHPMAAPFTKFLGKVPGKMVKKKPKKRSQMVERKGKRTVSKRMMAGNYNEMLD